MVEAHLCKPGGAAPPAKSQLRNAACLPPLPSNRRPREQRQVRSKVLYETLTNDKSPDPLPAVLAFSLHHKREMAARLQALARTIIGPGITSTASRPTLAATASTHLHQQQQQQQHRMASSTTTAEVRKYEWLVVIPDKPGMMAKRLEVRPQHFEGLTAAKESGLFKMGGEFLFTLALLPPPPPTHQPPYPSN